MIYFKKIIFYAFVLNILLLGSLFAQINNSIILKVGNSIVTSLQLKNEINTILILTKREINQKNINDVKNFAKKSIIRNIIKKNEIEKLEVKDYNKEELNKIISNISKSLKTNKSGLKLIFKKNGVSYDALVDKYKTDLLWNTLIFKKFKNQININIIEIDNDIKKIINKDDKKKIDIEKLRKKIINQQKNEKLELFSRSHYSNLENNTLISE